MKSTRKKTPQRCPQCGLLHDGSGKCGGCLLKGGPRTKSLPHPIGAVVRITGNVEPDDRGFGGKDAVGWICSYVADSKSRSVFPGKPYGVRFSGAAGVFWFSADEFEVRPERADAVSLLRALSILPSSDLANDYAEEKGRVADGIAALASESAEWRDRAAELLKALIEVGFERDMGDEMSCRGCGMPLGHVYERKHGTLYEGNDIRQCPVDEALKAVPVAGRPPRAKESK